MKTIGKTLSLLFLTLIVSVVSAQEKTEVRNVSGFTGIKVSESIQVELTIGNKEFVEVTADEEIIDRVVTEISGNNLVIHIKDNRWNGWHNKILVKVTATSINSLIASSSSSLVSQNLIESDKIELSVSSSARLKAEVKASSVTCKASSSGDMDVKGETINFEASASSSSGINADELKAKKVKAKASSSAKITCYADEEINADASSSGTIKYSGSPKMVDINESSSGDVHKR